MWSRLFKYHAKYAATFWLLMLLQISFAQEQRLADSLAKIYKNGKFLSTTDKLELLRNLSFNESNPELSLRYAEALIALAKREKNPLYLHRGYYQKGNKLRLAGNLDKSLAAFFSSANAASTANYPVGEGTTYSAIADVYSTMGNEANAAAYYAKAIKILRTAGNPVALGSAIINAGDEYLKTGKHHKALQHFTEAASIFKQNDYEIGYAYSLGNIGMVYAKQGKSTAAMEHIRAAVAILERLEDYYGISDYLIHMSDIYLEQKDTETALDYAKRSLALAQKYKLKDQISASNLKLSQLYDITGNKAAALQHYKTHIAYRDSVTNLESVQKIADLRTNYEVSQKQDQVDLLEKDKEIQQLKSRRQRNLNYATAISLFLIVLLAIGLYRRYKFIKKTNAIIEQEKNRSDALLLNILPEETAQELKESGKVAAKKFGSVSVLFTDFKGFTEFAKDLSPERLVESVDYYFSRFDAIIEKYDLEKIKTVGDSYMCAAGLPFETKDHAHKMVAAALEIAEFVAASRALKTNGQTRFEIRIGINSGPVVAGVVGSKKFAYDIWGDTVNIASRMESCSEPGKINISEYTYALVKEQFQCEYRGEIDVRNKGMMKMYFVSGPK